MPKQKKKKKKKKEEYVSTFQRKDNRALIRNKWLDKKVKYATSHFKRGKWMGGEGCLLNVSYRFLKYY